MEIKEMRFLSGMTQKAFSHRLQIPKRTIENWESGQRSCPQYLLFLIEYYLVNEGLISKQRDDNMKYQEDGNMAEQIGDQKMLLLEMAVMIRDLMLILDQDRDKIKPFSEAADDDKDELYYDGNTPRILAISDEIGYPFINTLVSYNDIQESYLENDDCFRGLHIDYIPNLCEFRIYSDSVRIFHSNTEIPADLRGTGCLKPIIYIDENHMYM